MKVFWKVQIRSNEHYSSVWSPTATWEMGLLSSDNLKAKWIELHQR